MTRRVQWSLLAVLSFALVWLVIPRGEEPRLAVTPARVVPKAKVEEPPIANVATREPRTHAYSIRRNLFAYAAKPVIAPPVIAASRIEQPRIVQPAAVVEVIAPKPQAPQFPYRFIGRFGPRGTEIAAFAREGEIVTARRGERVGGFTVKEIGLESVDVAGDAGITRIALQAR